MLASLLRRKGRKRFLETGTVQCPNQGRIDVEHCLSCGRLLDADLDADRPWVACTSGRDEDDLLYHPIT